jgi:hypothetical protein
MVGNLVESNTLKGEQPGCPKDGYEGVSEDSSFSQKTLTGLPRMRVFFNSLVLVVNT